MGELNSLPVTSSVLLFWIFGFVNAFLDLADLLGNGNLFGTDLRALPQGLATPGAVLVIQESNPFLRTLISRIEEIPKRADKGSRADIACCLRILIDGAGCRAAGAEDTTDGFLKKVLLLRRLTSFLVGWKSFCDQIRLDRIVLLKEGVQVNDQIFDHLKYRKRLDQNLLFIVPGQLLTGKAADAVDPHPVRSADAMAARPSVGERWVLLPSDSVEAIKKSIHRIGLHLIGSVVRLLVLLGIKAKDL